MINVQLEVDRDPRILQSKIIMLDWTVSAKNCLEQEEV